ncbi:agmatinase [Aureimonas phyllosphaerae]|uniref:Agmatinase n=1 Tax=Aureimonas phyllosphaerae TaxID=1166078 RepID=A0A7W6BXT7_9HYPH|nr:agmatinase [Aureimonas phyllosphaerae]MBB3934722.1 agmatinase [Aureimonas phyllosphaerae]MBB3958063.1 agmatinase [Aureimonas phyllosphaerae]SFE91223.1 agmatinase [Aureimonas phyllosphaerae]
MAGQTIDHAFTATQAIGAASDPTYAGALSFMRRRLTKDVAGSDVTVWGIPFDASVSNRPGTRFGPQALRRASAIFDNDPQYPFHADLFEALGVVDYGDCLLDYRLPERAHLAMRTEAEALLAKTGFLLTLGGDHSITFPLLQAHAAKHGPLSLVHFDAHQDTWPLATDTHGRPRVDHGSFVSAALRESLIDPESSIQIGIRTHAPETGGIEILHGYEVEDLSSSAIAERIAARVGGRRCYLTFDIDCLDVAFAPGTGTPVAGGPSSAKMLAVLRQLGKLDIVGADLVEVSPPYDHADMTAVAGATIAMYVLGLLAEKKTR